MRENLYKEVNIPSNKQLLGHNKKLRYMNDNYCELSRRTAMMREGTRELGLVLLFVLFFLTLFGTIPLFYLLFIGEEGAFIALFGLILVLLTSYYSFISFLVILFSPKDCPIRLNRKTGKVYVYEHSVLYLDAMATFKRSVFRMKEIQIKEFDWSDIQAFKFSANREGTYSIECVVYEPNSNEIADRFLLAQGRVFSVNLNFGDEWKWINGYMKGRDNILDKQVILPESLLIQPINWTEEMDRKSKANHQ